MKEFEPSRQFVAKVMTRVRAESVPMPKPRFRGAAFVGPALPLAGALLGVINLIRMLFTVFSPALCR